MKQKLFGTIEVIPSKLPKRLPEIVFHGDDGKDYLVVKNRNWARLKIHDGEAVLASGVIYLRFIKKEKSEAVFLVQSFFLKRQGQLLKNIFEEKLYNEYPLSI